jgi:hypothetical protein
MCPVKKLIVTLTLLAAVSAFVAPAARAGVEFNRDVRPILSDNCFYCHGIDPKHRKAGLRLDMGDSALAERDGVHAIVPGQPDKSDAWSRINTSDPDSAMPPPKSHKTLTAAQKQVILQWIKEGAKFEQPWAYSPIRKGPVPQTKFPTRNVIDAFLFSHLEQEGLKPSAEADRPTLIRRAAFALTGLPPAEAEVDAFLADASPDAYEHVVDRYMARPQFGEEMARYWLDVARYGDTHGLHLDNERQMWAYRDYVIKSFNDNKPFDQFTVEQLAGDLLPSAADPHPTLEQLTATGFDRCNVTTSEGGSINAEYLYRYAVDRTSTLTTAWMGLTGGCAVCHDHKFDPISTKEFYSLYSFFYSAADPAMDGNALLPGPTVKLNTPQTDAKLAGLDEKIAAKEKEIEAAARNVAYSDPALSAQAAPLEERETVWVDDDVPAGATLKSGPGQPTQWITGADGVEVYSGKRALKRSDNGLAQDYFEFPAGHLEIPADGRFFAYVLLDPKDPPKAIMLQYNLGGWEHRAIWGDDKTIIWGTPGKADHAVVGALPDTGRWIRLEVPVEKVGLKAGDHIAGVAMTQFGGTVTWDKIGIVGGIGAATDPAHSMTAWWKSLAAKPGANVPPEIAKLLAAGPEKVKAPADLQRVRDYYLANVCAETRSQFASMNAELAAIRKSRNDVEKAIPSTYVFRDLPKPRDAFVQIRGQYDKKGEKVEPGTPAFLPPMHKANPIGRATRLDLANWLVSPEHPLTSRVIVNRYWQQLFGIGLVKTSNDFGSQGEPPTNPQLLDYLAADFKDGGWDVKRLIRLMVTSAAFRESSVATPDLLARDPDNRLLARGPRFRLDAEQIRDNALAVSGLLNLDMGGPGVRPYQPPNIWEPVAKVDSNTRVYKQDTGPALYRRSIYIFLKRTAPAPFLANFDAPSREQTCTRRERSDTPLQALQLMNDVQHIEAARVLAEHIMANAGAKPDDRITMAFRTVLARNPEPDELAILRDQFAGHLERYRADEADARKLISQGESKADPKLPPAELAAYTMIASTLLNLDETLNRN